MRRATLGTGNTRYTPYELLEAKLNGIDITNLYKSSPELYYIFGPKSKTSFSPGLEGTVANCKKYIKDSDINTLFKTYLEHIIEESEKKIKKKNYDYYCNIFFDFYLEHLSRSIITIENFLESFINSESFIMVNNVLYYKDSLSSIGISISPELFNFMELKFIKNEDNTTLIKFIEQLYQLNSDYNPYFPYTKNYENRNKFSRKNFKGLPTRVFYGLSMQWDYSNINWEQSRGKSPKKSTIDNKTKLEYFINSEHNIQKKYLKKLSKKLGCDITDIIKLFSEICEAEENIENPMSKYFLRAFYLYSFLDGYNSTIRTNKIGDSFKKRIGDIGQTDGTFLSEVYDAYIKAKKDEKKKQLKSKALTKKRLIGMYNFDNNSNSNSNSNYNSNSNNSSSNSGSNNSSSNSGSNNSSSNSGSNNSSSNSGSNQSIRNPNNKFSPKSIRYNINFPNTLSKKKTT
jgi:uncharacterized membrane protein YgcG